MIRNTLQIVTLKKKNSLSDSESTPDSSNFAQGYLPQHIICASHTINHIATTDYKNSVNGLLHMRQENTQIFFKCSKLWNKCGRPKSSEIILEKLGHKLKVPGVTRWNSTYDAIVQIVSVKDKLGVLSDKLYD